MNTTLLNIITLTLILHWTITQLPLHHETPKNPTPHTPLTQPKNH